MPVECDNHIAWVLAGDRVERAASADSRPPRRKIRLKIITHVSAKVPLTNAWVNDVFPTARNPRMATLRCTMAGSFFGIVQTKMCHYTVQQESRPRGGKAPHHEEGGME